MKRPLVLPYSIMISPIRVLLRFILSMILAGGLIFIISLSLRAPSILSDPSVKPVLLFCLQDVLIFSIPILIFVSILVLFKILSFEKFRFLSRIILALLIAGSVFGLAQIWPQFQNYPVMPHKQDLKAQTIYKTSNIYFWASSVNETTMNQVMGFTDSAHEKSAAGKPIPLHTSIKSLTFNSNDGSFTNKDTKNQFKFSDIEGTSSSLLTTSESDLIESFGASVRYGLNTLMKIVSSNTLQSVVWALSIGFFCLSLWYWVRITRWPYWNGLWTFIWTIGIFTAVIILLLPENSKIIKDIGQPISDYVLPGGIAAISLILMILTLFLHPFKDWKKEVYQ